MSFFETSDRSRHQSQDYRVFGRSQLFNPTPDLANQTTTFFELSLAVEVTSLQQLFTDQISVRCSLVGAASETTENQLPKTTTQTNASVINRCAMLDSPALLICHRSTIRPEHYSLNRLVIGAVKLSKNQPRRPNQVTDR